MVDRRAQPSHGYRAVHVVVSQGGWPVEVQVRTELQNRWALLVERFADRWGQQVKYGEAASRPDDLFAGVMSRQGVIDLVHKLGDQIADHEASAAVCAVRRAYGFGTDHSLEPMITDVRHMIHEAFGMLTAAAL
jgi:ppGpp synthetase/RelA/SpoT-type nucleotidyltranferase